MLTCFLALVITFSAISQDIIEKNYFDSNEKLGGDIIIKKSTIMVEGTKTYKIFEIESPDNGNYYLNLWMMGCELENFGSGKFLEYELTINNEKQEDNLKPAKSNWHNAPFCNSKSKEKKLVKIKKGLNQIIFSCDAPESPNIEFLRLSKAKARSEISGATYNQFFSQIENKEQERIKNPVIKKDSLTTKLKSGVILPNPEGNYYHHIGISFRYTFYNAFSFNSGQQVFFSTVAPSGYEHVL